MDNVNYKKIINVFQNIIINKLMDNVIKYNVNIINYRIKQKYVYNNANIQ